MTTSTLRRSAVVLLALGALALTTVPAGAAAPVPGPSDDTPASCPSSVTDCPTADPFFTPPADLASVADGAIVGSRPATLATPEVTDVSKAYTVTYRSEDTFGAPVLDVTTVVLPSVPYAGTGARPLVSLQFAEDSLGRQCAPDYALAQGHQGTNDVIEAEAVDLDALLAAGYVVSVPDYQGPAEQFAVGTQEGHAVLDGIRASEALPAAGLTPATPVGMLGYSGGGLATGWASELMPSYAPELNVKGIAEGGVPADLKAAAQTIDGGVAFGLVALATEGVSRGYPQAGVTDVLNAAGRQLFAAIATECAQTAIEQYPLKSLDDYTTSPDALDSAQFAPLFAADHLEQHVPTVPIYDYHAYNDELIPYSSDVEMVDYYCAHGVSVTHVVVPGEHVSGEVEGAPGAIAWLTGRFNGAPDTSTCALPTIPAAGLPGAELPEAPLAVGLPLVALGLIGVVLRRRSRRAGRVSATASTLG